MPSWLTFHKILQNHIPISEFATRDLKSSRINDLQFFTNEQIFSSDNGKHFVCGNHFLRINVFFFVFEFLFNLFNGFHLWFVSRFLWHFDFLDFIFHTGNRKENKLLNDFMFTIQQICNSQKKS